MNAFVRPSYLFIVLPLFLCAVIHASDAQVITETPTQTPTVQPPLPMPTPFYDDESPVNVPPSDWHPKPVTVNHRHFEIDVLCRGIFNDSVLATRPETNELYFTEWDYREFYYPHRLIRISDHAESLYAPDLHNFFTMPAINEHAFYVADMDAALDGNMFFASQNGYPEDCVVNRKPNNSYDVIPIGGKDSLRSIYVTHQPYPKWELEAGDVLLLQVQRDDATRIYRLRLDETNSYQSTVLFETQQTKFLDITITPEGELFALSVTPYQINRLEPNGAIEPITHQEFGPPNDPRQGRIEYFAADRAFYVLPYKYQDIIRISEDGQDISHFTDGQSFLYLKASPNGKTLYTVNHTQYEYGSIQALRYIGDDEAALAAGDYNNDGQADASDARALLDAYLHNQTLSDRAMQYMDSNRDGRITPQDVQDLWRRIFGG